MAESSRGTADRARGIVLSGSAGVGKTRLAREAVAACGPSDARRQWIVGTASARSVPLGAFADIAGDFGPDPLRRVREVIDALVGTKPGPPVVIGVDDAHLLDDLSAFTVHQLVTRRLATVIVTIRSGESPPDAITAIWKEHHLKRLELQALSLTETTRLLEHVLDGPVHSLSARRLWRYTQGNTLYLRHLLDNEVSAGRITCRSGVWLWDGQLELSPALAELLAARIAQIPGSVRGVLDALAVSEPLRADILADLVGPGALEEAESLGLIRIDTAARPTTVRLSNPMLGEIRRAASLQLRGLRGRIATALARSGSTDPRDLVRQAVLTLDSDLAPDAGVHLAAASAAMQLLDLPLAETLAAQAVTAGGGIEARIALAMAIAAQERGSEAEKILAGIADEATGPVRTQVGILRATNFATVLGQPANAERELDMLPADDEDAQSMADALRACIDVTRGHARSAVDRARTVLGDPPADLVARMVALWALVCGLGDLGRIGEIEPAANRGYALANESSEVSFSRWPLAFLHAHAYRLAGALTEADDVIDRIHSDTFDVPFEGGWHAFLTGASAMSRGALADTRRSCREAIASLGPGESGLMMRGFARLWLATVAAVSGSPAEARREFAAVEWWDQDPDACEWDSEKTIAQAWVCASEGAVSQAVSILHDAAERERTLGRAAWEVVLLQTATQFGEPATAGRLAELADHVQGPRAPAAAAHAAALAARSGDGLLDASRRYEAFGDRIAAADAAAQAVVGYQRAGLRGAAMGAAATAQRLAAECHGAQTPALRAATLPQPFTSRQHEVISLAAQGLSNREIADRLQMSVRSVEGHLFRACQRVAANSREQLIAILRGR